MQGELLESKIQCYQILSLARAKKINISTMLKIILYNLEVLRSVSDKYCGENTFKDILRQIEGDIRILYEMYIQGKFVFLESTNTNIIHRIKDSLEKLQEIEEIKEHGIRLQEVIDAFFEEIQHLRSVCKKEVERYLSSGTLNSECYGLMQIRLAEAEEELWKKYKIQTMLKRYVARLDDQQEKAGIVLDKENISKLRDIVDSQKTLFDALQQVVYNENNRFRENADDTRVPLIEVGVTIRDIVALNERLNKYILSEIEGIATRIYNDKTSKHILKNRNNISIEYSGYLREYSLEIKTELKWLIDESEIAKTKEVKLFLECIQQMMNSKGKGEKAVCFSIDPIVADIIGSLKSGRDDVDGSISIKHFGEAYENGYPTWYTRREYYLGRCANVIYLIYIRVKLKELMNDYFYINQCEIRDILDKVDVKDLQDDMSELNCVYTIIRKYQATLGVEEISEWEKLLFEEIDRLKEKYANIDTYYSANQISLRDLYSLIDSISDNQIKQNLKQVQNRLLSTKRIKKEELDEVLSQTEMYYKQVEIQSDKLGEAVAGRSMLEKIVVRQEDTTVYKESIDEILKDQKRKVYDVELAELMRMMREFLKLKRNLQSRQAEV